MRGRHQDEEGEASGRSVHVPPERSSRKTSRLRCKLRGMLLDEQPQEECKKRSETASAVQESNTLDFDLMRSIASRTSEDLPVEALP